MMSALSMKQRLQEMFNQPVILFDDVHTHVGYFMGIGETVSAEKINFMIKHGRGLVYVCITEEKAEHMNLYSHRFIDNGYANITTLISVDYKSTTTGISAYERADTIRAMLGSDSQSDDFRRPGHLFPLAAAKDGLSRREGIAECAVTLTDMMGTVPVAYVCEILNEPGQIASIEELLDMSKAFGIGMLTFSEIITWHEHNQALQQDKVHPVMVNEAQVIHLPNLHFIQYCEATFGLNRGIFNTIDIWFYDKGIVAITERREHILKFLAFTSQASKNKKVNFKIGGGLTHQLSDYWCRLGLSKLNKQINYATI